MESSQGSIVDANDAFGQAQEKAIIERARQGDKNAFQQLYEMHSGRVYTLCLRLTGDRGIAEDATQEVFIQLWRKLDSYQAQSKFSTWLHSVTANVTVSYLRKQRSWLQRMFNLEDSGVEQRAGEQSSDSVDLETLVMKLPERARMVFVLHAIEGYRHEDIAQMLDMAVGSSKAQFHRAKQLLKEWMGYDEADI